MTFPSSLSLDVADEPRAADIEALSYGLERFNEQQWPGHQPGRPLGVFLHDPAKVLVAGLFGGTYSGWFYVQYLWVSVALRGQGIGRGLIEAAERRALERGCHAVWLDTFSFQAPEFYRRLGYELFGELDWSPEHKRLFFRKRLTRAAAAAFDQTTATS